MIFLNKAKYITNQFPYCGTMNGKMYCNLFSDGSIVEMDVDTGIMRQLNTTVISEPDCWSNGGRDYLYANGMIYIVENRRKRIACYDIENDNCSFYELNGHWYTLSIPNYTLATVFKDNIYIMPRFDKEVMVFCLKDRCVHSSYDLPIGNVPIPSSEAVAKDPVSAAIFSNAKRLGNSVFLTCDMMRKIVIFNLCDGSISYKDYPTGLEKCIDLVINDGVFYFLSIYGNVYWGDLNSGMFCHINIEREKLEFRRILVTNSQICLLPGTGKDIFIYSIVDKKLRTYDDYPDDFVYALRYPGMAKFFAGCEDDDWYYMAMCAQNYMLKVSKRTGEFRWIKPKNIPHEEKTQFYIKKGVSVINESDEYDLVNFFEYSHSINRDKMNQCGVSVYNFFMEGHK